MKVTTGLTPAEPMTSSRPRALWISPGIDGKGGISTLVYDMQDTPLWRDWGIRHVATHTEGGVVARIAAFLAALARLVVELAFHRPDIVHIHMSARGSFLRKCVISWICFASRLPVIIQVHGSNFDEFFDNSPRPLQYLIRKTLEHAEIVIGLGQTWAERLRRIAPLADIATITSAVRPAQTVDQSKPGAVGCVFLGEIGERKGTFVLLEAWASLIARPGVDATLTIAGNGDTTRARDLVTKLSVESTVSVRDWLSTPEVGELLAVSQVLVLPSRNEGTPRAILEAMARGLCVVASDVGGIPELLGDSGMLVKPDDVPGLADALERVVTDHRSRSKLGALASARVKERFDLGAVACRFDSLYRRVLDSRGGLTKGGRAGGVLSA